MKKIPSIRPNDLNNTGKYNFSSFREDIRWVFEEFDDIFVTRKFDGTCCLLENGDLYKRYDAQEGRIPPADFRACQEPDPKTGHWPGWIAVDKNLKENAIYFEEALPQEDGTYELCGPKVNNNPEKFEHHTYVKHGDETIRHFELKLNWVLNFLRNSDIEGVVFHHPDGRMAKITQKNFGLKRKLK